MQQETNSNSCVVQKAPFFSHTEILSAAEVDKQILSFEGTSNIATDSNNI
jgi:hypothetical protein